ncbi:hypothetical protein [Sphingomonas sp. GB1N7]|uniref:hypothetical protein n=1 Tax=Parasphingomonas caseinilytica TaxID=3096158 RepID=UPI002FCBA325
MSTVVRRIVNCTGPQGDIARSGEPLIQALGRAGQIRPDALKLGIDVNPRAQIINQAGRAHSDLYCIGPMTRGSFWETVAVPDIRRQAADLARHLSNAHWVGEGL